MIARLAGLFTIVMLTMGAATGPQSEDAVVREFRAASRLVRDGDFQADWNKLLDARARLERLVRHRDVDGSSTISWSTRVAVMDGTTVCRDRVGHTALVDDQCGRAVARDDSHRSLAQHAVVGTCLVHRHHSFDAELLADPGGGRVGHTSV